MIAYTVYSEAGGVGKTTIAANLAHAHVKQGDRVLAIDMDQQNGSLSRLLGTNYHKAEDGDADDLTLHMVNRPYGEFENLIYETPSGVDIIPAHNRIGNLEDFFDNAEQFERQSRPDQDDYEYPRYEQLQRVLKQNNVPEKYDVVIIDPNAKADEALRTAVYSTQNLVLPVEPSGKGQLSVSGLHSVLQQLQTMLGIEVSVLAAVPNDISTRVKDDKFYLEQLEESIYDVPVTFGDRRSLFRGCWREEKTAFDYVEEVRDRKRERELETLEKFETLASHIKQKDADGKLKKAIQ